MYQRSYRCFTSTVHSKVVISDLLIQSFFLSSTRHIKATANVHICYSQGQSTQKLQLSNTIRLVNSNYNLMDHSLPCEESLLYGKKHLFKILVKRFNLGVF